VNEPARPRRNPCPSCPYRRDAPSGIWAAEEYALLPRYDGDMVAQLTAGAGAAFHCHSTPALLCAGWLGHRDPLDLAAVRVGIAAGLLDPEAATYATDVALFGSGAAAAAHGVRDIEAPGPSAVEAVRKIMRARPGVT